jgi:hypothetical protein
MLNRAVLIAVRGKQVAGLVVKASLNLREFRHRLLIMKFQETQ